MKPSYSKQKMVSVIVALALVFVAVGGNGSQAAKKAIKLNKSSVTIKKGKSITLKATTSKKKAKIKWSISNKKVATVTQKGKVTGKKPGKAIITAKIKGTSKKATCRVKVQKNNSASTDRKEPGAYDSSGRLVKTWDDLIKDGVFEVEKVHVEVSYFDDDPNKGGMVYYVSGWDEFGRYPKNDIRVMGGKKQSGDYEEIVIPDGITVIDTGSFSKLTKIKKVSLPNSIRYINQFAFDLDGNRYDGSDIDKYIGYIDDQGIPQFNKYRISSLSIPDGVIFIGRNAFGGVDTVTYNGTATGAPWGAKRINPGESDNNNGGGSF